MKRKIALLYLNTGAGHHSAALALRESLQARAPEIPVLLINGFDQHNYWGKFIFEDIYRITSNYIPGAYSLIYDISQSRFAQSLYVFFLLRHRTARYLRKTIIQNHITDIVSFHFALTAAVGTVLDEIPWKVNLTVLVTDPFTAPHAWYYVRNTKILAYSQRVKNEAVSCCGVKPENIHIIPFLIDKKYRATNTTAEIDKMKLKHGFSSGKKILLLAGGGEGLPHAAAIIRKCVDHNASFTIAVVCGRNAAQKKYFDSVRESHPEIDLHVFGFVTFMDELIKTADLVVTKAGASMMMQLLVCRKPVIVYKYIHNQELGNMQFIVRSHVGWFIQNSGAIYEKIAAFFSDPVLKDGIDENYKKMQLDSDPGMAAGLLLHV
jgi:processive 1,2-diacylglycerol beta-glucosyltransferase/1,2-diacylglycerol 3-beta-galactosyltransferase